MAVPVGLTQPDADIPTQRGVLHPGPEPSRGPVRALAVQAAAEDKGDLVGAADVQVVPDHLLEEDSPRNGAVDPLAPEGSPKGARSRELEGYRGLAAVSIVIFRVCQYALSQTTNPVPRRALTRAAGTR